MFYLSLLNIMEFCPHSDNMQGHMVVLVLGMRLVQEVVLVVGVVQVIT